uniref:Uncharacterized protein n=1 Tax=Anguilla anguilla TaxID=7936 RepID=A0A0E9ST93_ANGAN
MSKKKQDANLTSTSLMIHNFQAYSQHSESYHCSL